MRKLLLTQLIFAITISLKAQGYFPLLGDTNQWNYVNNMIAIFRLPENNPSLSNLYLNPTSPNFAEKDSSRNGHNYKLLTYTTTPVSTFDYLGLIREDTTLRKIYFIPYGDTTEILLYNFFMNTGDSISLNFPNNPIGYGFQSGTYYLDSVIVRNIKAGPRKFFYLHNPNNPLNSLNGNAHHLVWIESTGNPNHLVYPYLFYYEQWGPLIDPPINESYESHLVCKTSDHQRIFFDSLFHNGILTAQIPCFGIIDSCDYYPTCGSVNYSETDAISSVFPVPAQNKLTLEIKNSSQSKFGLILLDLNGKELFRKEFTVMPDEKYNLDISNLNSGLYFIHLSVNGKICARSKFIKAE